MKNVLIIISYITFYGNTWFLEIIYIYVYDYILHLQHLDYNRTVRYRPILKLMFILTIVKNCLIKLPITILIYFVCALKI